MKEPSTQLVLGVPALICAAMVSVGIVTATISGISGAGLVLPYMATAVAFTILAGLAFTFIEFGKLALVRADRPVPIVVRKLCSRFPLLILPTILFPLLLAGYTTAKTAIPFVVGYRWERFWADADKLVFGEDVWRLSRPLVEWAPIPLWEWVYSAGWGVLFFVWLAAVPFYASKERVGVMYTAMFSSWLLGGWLIAYSTSAAGPVFAHLTDPVLADRFLPMQEHLRHALDAGGPIRMSQAVLTKGLEEQVVITGAGISAMPSMHLATATIYVIAALRSWWIYLASIFWAVIFIGSGYFGYHYWLDGIVAAIIATLCWRSSELIFNRSEFTRISVQHPVSAE